MMRATVLICAMLLAAAVAVSVSSESRTPLYEWVRVPRQWQLIGRAPASLRHNFTVALHAANRNVLERRFWEIATPGHPQYRKFMTTEEVQALVDPGVHVRQPVVDWLRSESGVQVTEHADFIKVEAPIRAIERLFDTKMVLYKHARTGKSIVRHTGATSVPTHVRPNIHLIEGLHEFPRVRNMKASAAGPQTPDAAFPFVSYAPFARLCVCVFFECSSA
jgi:tripeptidyl-peptidase-1